MKRDDSAIGSVRGEFIGTDGPGVGQPPGPGADSLGAGFSQSQRRLRLRTALPTDALLLVDVQGTEGLSRLFQFDVELASADPAVPADRLVGRPIAMAIASDVGDRYVHGVVSQLAQGATGPDFTTYRARIVPSLWLLTQNADCRIFQRKSVVEIVTQLLKERGLTDFEFRLVATYRKRRYCVQYRESDYDFIARLLEDEGIYFYFEHRSDRHVLVMADAPGFHRPCPARHALRYVATAGAGQEEQDRVTGFERLESFRPSGYAHTDYNFKTPTIGLNASAGSKHRRGPEVFEFPGTYKARDEGDRLARVRQEEIDASRVRFHGASYARALTAGHKFDLGLHPNDAFNGTYVLTEVRHRASEAASFLADDRDADFVYANEFECLPASIAFRPPRVTPQPIVRGSQTAVVTGPPGEEIFTDKFGRVKVQFFWDRRGKHNENSSCWVRVNQPWAGKGWGAISIPRIGQEVIVDFLEGNPDRPIITGRVYNAEQMPPYPLPAGANNMGMKSKSVKGGGYNEISINDSNAAEGITIHAQYDMGTVVNNNETRKVGVNFSEEVGVNAARVVGVNDTEQVGTTKVVNVGSDLMITAGRSITLKCGASLIHMNKAGVITISGSIIGIAGSMASSLSAPMTSVSGGLLLNMFGTLNLSNGVITRVEGAALGHFGGAKAELTATGDCMVQGAKVKLN